MPPTLHARTSSTNLHNKNDIRTMSTTGHESEAIKVSGLKAAFKKGGNKGLFNEATCSTAGGTAAKVTNTVPPSFSLTAGAKIIVKFTYAISAENATLQVGETAAKPIYYRGAALPAGIVKAGDRLLLSYNGTQWDVIGHLVVADESLQAVSSGTALSLVTTGEKFQWNSKTSPTINTTYAALKALRDNSQLIAGQWYRITDFVTTTNMAYARSAGHPFDIVVFAVTPSELDGNAYAAPHEGDTYFANSRPDLWKIEYCIDNNSKLYQWAAGDVTSIYLSDNTWKKRYTAGDAEGAAYPYAWSTNGTSSSGRVFTASETPSAGDSAFSASDGTGDEYTTEVFQESGKGVIINMVDEFGNDVNYDFKNMQFKLYKVADSHPTRTSLNNRYVGFKPHLPADNPYKVENGAFVSMGSTLTIPDESVFIWAFTFSSSSASTASTQTDNSLTTSKKIYGNVLRGFQTTLIEPIIMFGDTNEDNNIDGGFLVFAQGSNYCNKGGYLNYGVFGGKYNMNVFHGHSDSVTCGVSLQYSMFENATRNAIGDSCTGLILFSQCSSNLIGNNVVCIFMEGKVQYCYIPSYMRTSHFGEQVNYIYIEKNYTQNLNVESRNAGIILTSDQTTSSTNILDGITIKKLTNKAADPSVAAQIKTISHNTVNDDFETTYQNANNVTVNV